MKVRRPIYLYVTPFFPRPESWRGGYCLDAVKALMRTNKYEVRVFVPGSGPDYEIHGVRVHRFPVVRIPCGLFPFVRAFFVCRSFFEALNYQKIALQDVDVCHVHTVGLAALAAAVKRACPHVKTLVHHHCCVPVNVKSGRLGAVLFHAELVYLHLLKTFQFIDAHVFVSKKSAWSFGKYYRKMPEGEWGDIREQLLFGSFFPPLVCKKKIVAYNGIDTGVFHPIRRNGRNKFTIGCVGNFQPLKDQITLLRAFVEVVKVIPNANLRFVGSGECLAECVRFAEGNFSDGVVSFESEMDHLRLPEFYHSIDLFVLPSRMEGLGCVYLEAYGCGVPFIACLGTGIDEVLPEGEKQDWLVSPRDEKELAEKIIAYAQKRNKLHLARSFDVDDVVSAFLDEVGVM